MKRLSRDAFDRAAAFLEKGARPLERELFRFRFRFTEGSAQAVEEQLSHYANPDGGFGRALEPDTRTPSSSALATALALQILQEIGATADHPLVRGAVEWLLQTLDRENLVWRAVAEDANEHPHTPWWHDDGRSLAQTFDGFRLIPRALLVGLLHHFSSAVDDPDLLSRLAESTVSSVESVEQLGVGGGSDLEYVLHLAEEPAGP